MLLAATAQAAPALDPTAGAIFSPAQAKQLLHQCSRSVPSATDFWQPDATTIRGLEARLPNALTAIWQDHRRADSNAPSQPVFNFGRQYAGLIVGGRKIVYVNVFPNDMTDFDGKKPVRYDWKSKPVIVCDGGDNFFGIEYDPETKTFSHFEFNGYA
jgi:hypothetical protein